LNFSDRSYDQINYQYDLNGLEFINSFSNYDTVKLGCFA